MYFQATEMTGLDSSGKEVCQIQDTTVIDDKGEITNERFVREAKPKENDEHNPKHN